MLKRLTPGAFAIADQAWLSAVNLVIAVALIRAGDKREYGLYVLLLSVIYLFQGLQNALFLSPLATVLPRAATHLQTGVASASYVFQAVFGVFGFALCLSSLLVYVIFWPESGVDASLAMACSAALLGNIAREGVRATEYAQRDVGRAFRGDLIYGIAILALMGCLLFYSELTATAVLWVIGIAGVFPALFMLVKKDQQLLMRLRGDLWREFWLCGRWALLGVLLSWLSLNSYSYIASWTLGLEAVADLNAARLLVMPVALGTAAWSAFFRPRFAAWHSAGDYKNLRVTSSRSITWGLVALLVLGYCIHTLSPVIPHIFGEQYQGLGPLALLWVLFFAAAFIRAVYMASLMVDHRGYRTLTSVAAVGVSLMVPAMGFASFGGAIWIVATLTVVEAAQALLVRRAAPSYWQGVK